MMAAMKYITDATQVMYLLLGLVLIVIKVFILDRKKP